MTRKSQKPQRSGEPELTALEQRLRDGEQQVTVQRRAILRYLLRRGEHCTTAEIASAVGRSGSASLATVYNNLALFARLGILLVVRAPDGEQYWDLRTEPHHHLRCLSCGQVDDIDVAAAQVVVRDARLRRRVQQTSVWLTGLCARCG